MNDEKIITFYKYAEIDVETDDNWSLLEIIPSSKIILPETTSIISDESNFLFSSEKVTKKKKTILPFIKINDEDVEDIKEDEEKKSLPIKLIPKTRQETYGKRRGLIFGLT
jgi:hypothetical protein